MIFPGWGFAAGAGLRHRARPTSGWSWSRPTACAWSAPCAARLAPSRGLLLVFGGNAEDADWRLRHFGGWLDDVDIATFFYRGFGPSGGVPSEPALVADAVLIHDHVVERPAAVAGGRGRLQPRLGRRRPARPGGGRWAVLILVTAFDSIAADRGGAVSVRPGIAGSSAIPSAPTRRWPALPVPVAVIGAEADRIVPPEHTRRLVDELAQPVLVTWIADADHVSIYDRARVPGGVRRGARPLADPSAEAADDEPAATSL